jgi:hypothetical protein
MRRATPERVTPKSDDGGRHHVAFVAFGFDFSAPGKSGSLGKEVRITDWKFEYGTQQVKVLSR